MLDVAWLDDTPYVTEITDSPEAGRGIKVHDSGESLKRMWAEIGRLRGALDEAQLRSIEARNPGIDMAEVRRTRAARLDGDRP